MKRPDVALRNSKNNPMADPINREKMRQSLTGRKLPEEVKAKMSASRKRLIRDNPRIIKTMLIGTEEKYLSKIRGKGWRLARLKALERDNYTCRQCGEAERRLLVVHH